MFGDKVPQMLEILKWGGLVLIVLGIILFIVDKKIEPKKD